MVVKFKVINYVELICYQIRMEAINDALSL